MISGVIAVSYQIPVNKVRTFGDLRNVLMKRIFLSALHFRINTRYQVHCLLSSICSGAKSHLLVDMSARSILWCTAMVPVLEIKHSCLLLNL